MGLDMYLTQEVYVGAHYEHREVTGIIDLAWKKGPIDIPLNKVQSIRLSIGYWRKANAIHNWFVKNVQNGVDECQEVYVRESKLMELKDICEQTLKLLENSPTKTEQIVSGYKNGEEVYVDVTVYDVDKTTLKLLPAEGFFFGSTEIDDWFVQDLKDTIEIIDNIDFTLGSILYQSSW